MTGGWVSTYPDDVKAIAAAGHDLGNHSENHKQMSQLSAEECQKEIQSVHDRVKELTGQEMCLFRPPYGDYNDTLIEAAEALHYYTIQWNCDSLDWKNLGVEPMIQRTTKNLHPGDILLFHNNSQYITQALPAIIESIQSQGYQIVPISELVLSQPYWIDHTGMQHAGIQRRAGGK